MYVYNVLHVQFTVVFVQQASCVILRHFADRNVYNSDSPVEPVHPPNKSLVDPVLVIPPGQAGQQNFWHLSLTAVVLVKGD